ncbi:hypothetical protein [Bacillus mojavensis]
MRSIKVGEYEVIEDLKNGIFKALRHGEEWRHLVGDNLILSLIDNLEGCKEKLSKAEDLLSEAHDLLDDVHCYDTDVYHSISKYFRGEDE